MKTIQGNKVTCSLFVYFDFTKEEADQFLSAPLERRSEVLNDLLITKHPNHEHSSYNADQFHKAIGASMVQWRENELKQLGQGGPDLGVES